MFSESKKGREKERERARRRVRVCDKDMYIKHKKTVDKFM